jgi:hypothetical protein
MIFVWNLEPCEFSTILPSPLTHVILSIGFGILEGDSVILIESNSVLVCVLLYDWDLKFHIAVCNAHKDITKFSSPPVLNTKSKSISDVEHEVSIVDTFAIKDTIYELFVCGSQLIGDSFLNIVGDVLNRTRTCFSTS